MERVYCKEEAERILASFPAEKMDELLVLAHTAYDDFKKAQMAKRKIILPEGWHCILYGNCIDLRYLDGDTDLERTFYVPEISIDFLYKPEIVPKKTVLERLALGHCSCGKPIPVIQALVWSGRMTQNKGIFWPITKPLGFVAMYIVCMYINMSPHHQQSMRFNRHVKCI